MLARIHPGAPGVYEQPPDPLRALTGERMDVCAFVGVAPRGPAHAPRFDAAWAPVPPRGGPRQRSLPVPVEGWSEYVALFGSFEGPGLLPWAVESFFENGGRRAWIVRVLPDYPAAEEVPGIARAVLPGITRPGGADVGVRARSPGRWGNALTARLRFSRRPLVFEVDGAGLTEVRIPRDADLPPGSLLRLGCEDGTTVLRQVTTSHEDWDPERGSRRRFAVLDAPLPDRAKRIEVVEGTLLVAESGGTSRNEVHAQLGFGAAHPRFLGRVLVEASRLLYPDERPGEDWTTEDLRVDPALVERSTAPFVGGADDYRTITPADFFSDWLPGDEEPGDGVHALTHLEEIALLCAPDLYVPFALEAPQQAEQDPVGAGAEFAPCLPVSASVPPPSPPDELEGLRLDPRTELQAITELQAKLVELAEQLGRFTVLLDVPPGLDARRIDQWRARFDSAWAAAYHPWLYVGRGDAARERRTPSPPSAAAAGIIAASEAVHGLPHGPANAYAQGAVDLFERVSPRRHDELHQHGLNVFLLERDGAWLSGARTLSRVPQWRQLSVRRLVTLLRRALHRQLQWAVFEPNSPRLRSELVRVLVAWLRQLHRGNAFAGRSEAESFFVRCDDAVNPPWSVEAGRLVIEIGVAPAEPIEFIVLRIAREADGTVVVEDPRG